MLADPNGGAAARGTGTSTSKRPSSFALRSSFTTWSATDEGLELSQE